MAEYLRLLQRRRRRRQRRAETPDSCALLRKIDFPEPEMHPELR